MGRPQNAAGKQRRRSMAPRHTGLFTREATDHESPAQNPLSGSQLRCMSSVQGGFQEVATGDNHG